MQRTLRLNRNTATVNEHPIADARVAELTQQLKTEKELRKITEAAFAELQKMLARSIGAARIGKPAGTEVQYNAMRREYVVVTRFYEDWNG